MNRRITQRIRSNITLVSVTVATLLLGVAPQAVGQPDADANWFIHVPQFVQTNKWGAVTNDCQLGLRVTKPEFEAGESIYVYIYFRNVGTHIVEYANSVMFYDYEIKNTSTGQGPVYTEQYAQQLKPGQRMGGSMGAETVLPNEQHLNRLLLTKRYKLSEPGTYVITVKQRVWLAEVLSRRPLQTRPIGNFELRSNPVIITIVPKSKK